MRKETHLRPFAAVAPSVLVDRIACALFSFCSALALGALIWLAIKAGLALPRLVLPFWPVTAVALCFGGLGFLLLDNLVANVLGRMMRSLLWMGRNLY